MKSGVPAVVQKGPYLVSGAKPLRIVLVINGLIYGGAETQVIAISRELEARGHSVTIYTLNSENPRAVELASTRVRVIGDSRNGKFDPALVLRLRKTLLDFKADIVHGFLLSGNLYARLAAAGTGIVVLNSERSDNYQMPVHHRLALMLTRSMVDGLVANSHAGARFAQQFFRLPPKHVDVVWNGIQPNIRAQENRNASRDVRSDFFSPVCGLKIATVVAMFRPEKDHALALRVAQALHEKDSTWRMLFVGESLPHTGDYKRHISDERRRLGLEQVVKFAGLRRDVGDIVKQSNVLLSTSIHEGFPNVVLEAMASGTPVVSTDYSDIGLILPNPWQIVKDRNPVELANAIISAEMLRASVSKQQSEWLRANATLTSQIDLLEAVYHKYTAA